LKERIESRKKAYSLVLKKIKELGFAHNYRLNKIGNDIGYISLNDGIGSKEGTNDPPLQLVTSFKKLIQGTANETEIDQYLIQAFIDQSPNHTKSNNP